MDAAVPTSRGKLIAFRLVAVLGAVLGLLAIVFAIQSFVDEKEKIHIMHNIAGATAWGLLVGVALLLVAYRPEGNVVAFRVALGASVASLIVGILDPYPGYYLLPIVAVILLMLHPARGEVLGFERPSLLMAAVGVASLIPGIPYALSQADLQRADTPGDPHVEFHHYSGMSAWVLIVGLAALWASTRARGERAGVWLVGFAAVLQGLASLVYPDYPGAFDTGWAWIALAGGIAYIGLGEARAEASA